ncbi:hypothetical protein KOW79_002101 [Hemibagrus wyckioides]|uniref:Uncharacterized protein n=1 Tax=Hemibagrus wyckioides TaxID=337641 RepID=A0A9D3SVW0_9TELE|nr:hypothetical protein KOW79_002101 [Hemibagrus wyckioides]
MELGKKRNEEADDGGYIHSIRFMVLGGLETEEPKITNILSPMMEGTWCMVRVLHGKVLEEDISQLVLVNLYSISSPSALLQPSSPLPSSYSPLKWIQFSQVFRFSHCRSSDSFRNEAHEAGLGDGVDKDETDETCISQC